MIAIHPSLIAGDLLNLESQIKTLEPYCDGFHLDIMDFHFVPNLTWGPLFINAIAKFTVKPLYIHLMVDTPESYLPLLELRPGDTYSFHIESCLTTPAGCNPVTGFLCPSTIDYVAINELAQNIKNNNLLTSIALRPATNFTVLERVLDVLDDVLLMSVDPGFSGQQFLPGSIGRLDELVQFRAKFNKQFTITMDGGINETNIKQLALHGVTACAIGSALFKKDQPQEFLQKLKQLTMQ